MPHSLNFQPSALRHYLKVSLPQSNPLHRLCRRGFALIPAIALSLLVNGLSLESAHADSPETAPPELIEALAQIDAAASRQDLSGVMQFYDRALTHSDGLSYQTLENALAGFWERYDNLTYQTELTSWEPTENGIVTETVTTITGVQRVGSRRFDLTATLASRQRFQGQRIVSQEILTERNQLTAGSTPPTLDVILPEQVSTGQEFPFDVIVMEPLGDRILLGAAVEEPIRAEGHTSSADVNLSLLSAGGLFKVGQAPALAGNRWLSAAIVREDGIALITQRLRVSGRTTPARN